MVRTSNEALIPWINEKNVISIELGNINELITDIDAQYFARKNWLNKFYSIAPEVGFYPSQ
jgi:hypothetical protein